MSLHARPVLDMVNSMGASLCICGRIVAYNMCVYYLTVIYSMEMLVFYTIRGLFNLSPNVSSSWHYIITVGDLNYTDYITHYNDAMASRS